MVYLIDNGSFYEFAELFEVYDEPCCRVRLALYRHVEREIMPVPILIGALAKDLVILLRPPFFYIKSMGGIEMFFTRNVTSRQGNLFSAKLGYKP